MSVPTAGTAALSQQRLSELNALAQVISEINQSLDPEEVFSSSLEGIQRVAGGEFGCVLLIEPDAPTLRLARALGLPAPLLEQLQRIAFDPDLSVSASARDNQPESIVAIGQQMHRVLQAQGITSFIMLPLTARGRAIGILLVGVSPGKLLTPLSVDLLMSIGEQVGMAIENARLHVSLAESEAWRRDFMENSPEGFWESDVEEHILYANDSACKILGCSRDELLQMRRSDFLVRDRATHETRLSELLQTQSPASRIGKIRTCTGEIRSVSYATHVVRDAQGRVTRLRSIFRDVTDEQRSLETLQQRNQEQAALNAIANILSSPLEIAKSMDQVCEQIATIIGMETVTIHLMDEAGQFLNLAACRGMSDDLRQQVSRLGLDDPMTRRIAVEGQTIALNDLLEYTGVGFAGPRVEGYHAGIGAPILQRGSPIGSLFVGSQTQTHYEPSDVALLLNIGNQIGVALENARLYAQMQQRVQELDGLAQLSAACVASLDPEVLAQIIANRTVHLMQADTCTVRTVEGETVQFLAGTPHWAANNPVSRFQFDAITRSIVEERKSYLITDLQTDTNVNPLVRTHLMQLGLQAVLTVPMTARDRVIGILTVGAHNPHSWQPRELDLLQTIANQVGVTLENARLYAQMNQRVQELDGLAQLSAACVASLDPQAVAEIAVEWTQRLYVVDVVDLSLFQDGKLYRMAARISHSATPLTAPIALGELATPILERREPLIVNNLQRETATPDLARELMSPRGLQALLVVPLVTHERAIGTLAVVHTQPRQWLPQERDLLQTIANQVANAIDNAQLYQNALNEQRKVQAIFDSGLSGLYATDAAGKIMMFNRAAERITGWTLDEARGKNWAELFGDHATGNSQMPLIDEALIHKKVAYVPEGRKMRTRDDRVIPVAKAVAPLLDEKENIIGAVGAFWDLSKEQRAEIEYENFLAMVAHQLRSPLTSVLSALELFERRNLPEERRAELWAIIKTEGNQLKKLADQFLEHQAAAKSSRPVRFEPLSVATLARQLVRQFQTAQSKRHFRIQVSNPEPLAFADMNRVEHVLRNLLDNAVSYSPVGSRILVRIKPQDEDWVNVSVQDSGAGIPLSEQSHIFQPFYRVPQTSTRRIYGHGLGLALAKEMVDAMGGQIWVGSEPEHGATFHFTLRRAR